MNEQMIDRKSVGGPGISFRENFHDFEGQRRGMQGERIYRRRTGQVEKISDTDCLYTTSLQTQYGGAGTAAGIMFTLLPTTSMQIVTMEFDIRSNNTLPEVLLYAKQGDFSGAVNDQSLWTPLADSVAQLTPGGDGGAIIPAATFSSITLQANTQYSFYLHIKNGNDMLRFNRRIGALIGETFSSDDLGLLGVQTGVSLKALFPEAFEESVEFSGRLHYKTTQPCESIRKSTTVDLEFAINSDATEEIIAGITDAVRKSVDALILLDPQLIQFRQFHALEVSNVESSFMGRSRDKCPDEFGTCSNVFSTVTLLHLSTVSPGAIKVQIFDSDSKIAEAVKGQSLVEIEYVGHPIMKMDFVITLNGVPPASRMNIIQKEYFESVTATFLDASSEMPIFNAEVFDEVITLGSDNGKRRLGTHHLRGWNRGLQDSSSTNSLQIGTSIIGGSSDTTMFRTNILEAIELNPEAYVVSLTSQLLRPGRINEGQSGDLFLGVTDAFIMLKPADFGSSGESSLINGPLPEISDRDPAKALWLFICSAGVALSVVYLVYRVYKDFLSSSEQKRIDVDLRSVRSGRSYISQGSRSFHSHRSLSGRPSFEDRRSPLDRRPSMDSAQNRNDVLSNFTSHSAPDRFFTEGRQRSNPHHLSDTRSRSGGSVRSGGSLRRPNGMSEHVRRPASSSELHQPGGPPRRVPEPVRGVVTSRSMPLETMRRGLNPKPRGDQDSSTQGRITKGFQPAKSTSTPTPGEKKLPVRSGNGAPLGENIRNSTPQSMSTSESTAPKVNKQTSRTFTEEEKTQPLRHDPSKSASGITEVLRQPSRANGDTDNKSAVESPSPRSESQSSVSKKPQRKFSMKKVSSNASTGSGDDGISLQSLSVNNLTKLLPPKSPKKSKPELDQVNKVLSGSSTRSGTNQALDAKHKKDQVPQRKPKVKRKKVELQTKQKSPKTENNSAKSSKVESGSHPGLEKHTEKFEGVCNQKKGKGGKVTKSKSCNDNLKYNGESDLPQLSKNSNHGSSSDIDWHGTTHTATSRSFNSSRGIISLKEMMRNSNRDFSSSDSSSTSESEADGRQGAAGPIARAKIQRQSQCRIPPDEEDANSEISSMTISGHSSARPAKAAKNKNW